MPAVSKSQRRLFAMVNKYKKGELKDASKKIRDIASHMDGEDVRHFAATKEKGLPEKKASFESAVFALGFLNRLRRR